MFALISLKFSRSCFAKTKFLELREFNKTIIPFALVGYETGYSQLGATCLIGYLLSYPMRTRGIIVKYLLLVEINNSKISERPLS